MFVDLKGISVADCTAPSKMEAGVPETAANTADCSVQQGHQRDVPQIGQNFQRNPLFGMESSLTQSHIGFVDAAALGMPTPATPGPRYCCRGNNVAQVCRHCLGYTYASQFLSMSSMSLNMDVSSASYNLVLVCSWQELCSRSNL